MTTGGITVIATVALVSMLLATGTASNSIEDSCRLIGAVVHANGQVKFGRRSFFVPSALERFPPGSKIANRLVVDPKVELRHGRISAMFEDGVNCDHPDFVLRGGLAQTAVPSHVLKIIVRRMGFGAKRPLSFRFWLQWVDQTRPPVGWYTSDDVPGFFGKIWEERGKWVGRLLALDWRGHRPKKR